MKPQIRIADTQFAHSGQGSYGAGDLQIPPAFFDWVRCDNPISDLIVITEASAHLVDTFSEKIKILLIIESPMINPDIYNKLSDKAFTDKFTYILTFSLDHIGMHQPMFYHFRLWDKFMYTPFGGCWLFPHEQKIYEKNLNVSIIASDKRATPNHLLRHEVIAKLGDKIDGIFGRGYNTIKSKLEGLEKYRFHIVIENDSCNGMFSEKLIDALMAGCIVFYCGDKFIGKRFNLNAILCFETCDELEILFNKFGNKEYYDSQQDAIKHNFDLAHLYSIPEDLIYTQLLKTLINVQPHEHLYIRS